MFYEKLWRDYWHVSGNIGDVPGELPDSNKWIVPEQPELTLFGVEILGAPEGLLENVRVRVYKGSNFAPELRYDSGKGEGNKLTFDFPGAKIQGNFKIGIDAAKGYFKSSVKALELWHNTLFMNK